MTDTSICRHKFVDSKVCLLCGWSPPRFAIVTTAGWGEDEDPIVARLPVGFNVRGPWSEKVEELLQRHRLDFIAPVPQRGENPVKTESADAQKVSR
jgi:hypothetical protein